MAALIESITSPCKCKEKHSYSTAFIMSTKLIVTQAKVFLEICFLTTVKKTLLNISYKMVALGRNTVAKQMKDIASTAFLDSKFTGLSGRKTIISQPRQRLSAFVQNLEAEKSHWCRFNSMLQLLKKQRRMSGFAFSATA